MRTTPPGRGPGPRAFTLIEILVVIGILGLLMALIAPVVVSALRQTRTRTKALGEIERLGHALEAFRAKYGVYPPSHFVLREDGAWPDDENKAVVERIWPDFDFTRQYDLNNDGSILDTYTLDGFECLVFFLSGVPDPETGVGRGFATDGTNPFDPSAVDRTTPIFTFAGSRLVDGDGDGFREFRDPMDGKPYAYFSAYGGRGYIASDCAVSGEPSETFDDLNSAASITSNGPNPYTEGPPNPGSSAAVYARADSYQIICAGEDGRYGSGGQLGSGLGQYDQDNLTNFQSAELRQGGG